MAHTGRERHRDRDFGHRHFEDVTPVSPNRMFRLTDAQRQQIAESLRYIDAARRELESRQNPDNREIIRELRVSADEIFDVVKDLEELDS